METHTYAGLRFVVFQVVLHAANNTTRDLGRYLARDRWLMMTLKMAMVS